MKKHIIIAAVIIAALAFGVTSCKKEDKAKCWKVTVSAIFSGETESHTVYIWCTEAESDSRIAETKKAAEDEGGTDFKAVREEASKYTTQTDCESQTDSENIPLTLPDWIKLICR